MSETKSEDIKENIDENEKIESTVVETPKKPANIRRIVLLLILLVIVALLAVFVFWYMNNNGTKKVTVTNKTKSCGTLTTEDGKTEGLAPYKPVMVATIDGEKTDKIQYCQWSYNDNDLGKTMLYQGECVRDGLNFSNIGVYKVKYSVVGTNCQTEATLKVTGLSEAEKAELLKIKTSGVKSEDLK
ncbi:MAG: hypothetical protein WC437_02920 [Patescibacteria group bacterium]|jgi:hypothetical protein|nr:hypothetical protein [Patescibacteria group bacterium]